MLVNLFPLPTSPTTPLSQVPIGTPFAWNKDWWVKANGAGLADGNIVRLTNVGGTMGDVDAIALSDDVVVADVQLIRV